MASSGFSPKYAGCSWYWDSDWSIFVITRGTTGRRKTRRLGQVVKVNYTSRGQVGLDKNVTGLQLAFANEVMTGCSALFLSAHLLETDLLPPGDNATFEKLEGVQLCSKSHVTLCGDTFF